MTAKNNSYVDNCLFSSHNCLHTLIQVDPKYMHVYFIRFSITGRMQHIYWAFYIEWILTSTKSERLLFIITFYSHYIAWFQSFMSPRSSFIHILGKFSSSKTLPCDLFCLIFVLMTFVPKFTI